MPISKTPMSDQLNVGQVSGFVQCNLCPFQPFTDYGFFMIGKVVAVACYGEVWTDEDSNIIRMSEHLDLSDKLQAYKGWENESTVVTYGWLKRADEPPRLIPLTIYEQGKNKQIYWCRGAFMNYRVFSAKSRLLAGTLTP